MSTPAGKLLLVSLWRHLKRRRRLQLYGAFVVMVVSSVAEIASISAVIPLLSVLFNPEKLWQHRWTRSAAGIVGVETSAELITAVTIAFAIAAIVAAAVRILNVFIAGRLAAAIGSDLSSEAYFRTLHQPYSVHVARNSSEVISSISHQVGLMIHGILRPILEMATAALVLVSVSFTLVLIDPQAMLVIGGVFGGLYGISLYVSRKSLVANSALHAKLQQQLVKNLQEGLGAVRDVLLDGSQSFYVQSYQKADRRLWHVLSANNLISLVPRYLMECVGLLMIALFAYELARSPVGFADAVPKLGALALGAQRLLPVLQQIYSGVSALRSHRSALEGVLALLAQPLPTEVQPGKVVPRHFTSSVQFRSVSFRYEGNRQRQPVLQDVNFEIVKGSRVGIVGKTGSGKSTLLDILMGLLPPSSGIILVDGTPLPGLSDARELYAWRATIAHVPQSIFIADISIAENIALGVPKEAIDFNGVLLAAKQARVAEFVEQMDAGYDTLVGERGIRLSGGQRQRIGIARALYKRAEIIVFDEATSALDTETERSVMEAIEDLSENLTLVIVAHRLTTLRCCTSIIALEGGRATALGAFDTAVVEMYKYEQANRGIALDSNALNVRVPEESEK